MRNTNLHIDDPQIFTRFAGSARQSDGRLAPRIVAHFNIAPRDTADPTRAKGFQHRFFGGPTTSIVLCGGFPRSTVFHLVVRIDAIDELISVPFDHLSDSKAFDDIRSNSDDAHTQRIPGVTVLMTMREDRRRFLLVAGLHAL